MKYILSSDIAEYYCMLKPNIWNDLMGVEINDYVFETMLCEFIKGRVEKSKNDGLGYWIGKEINKRNI